MKKLNEKGFTLIEVLAVVAIIGILGLISVPSVLNMINNGKKASYNILIDNIKTAAVNLYEEVELMGNTVYKYVPNETELSLVTIEADGNESKFIKVNLQTLVNNGFLKGSKNDSNELVILDPKTNEDIGLCEIKIKKTVGDKVSYEVSSTSDNNDINLNCPTFN